MEVNKMTNEKLISQMMRTCPILSFPDDYRELRAELLRRLPPDRVCIECWNIISAGEGYVYHSDTRCFSHLNCNVGRLEHGQGAQPVTDKDTYSTMDIYSQRGAKIRFLYPTNGYPYDQKQCSQFLKLGETYTVERTEVHSSHTNVVLREFPGQYFNSVMFGAAPPEQPQGSGEPQLPQCSVCNATMQRRGDSLRCIVCEEGWTTERPTGEPKHCSELLDTGVISELHDAIQEAKGESAGLADRGEPQVTVQIIPQWMVRFTYWDGVTTSDGFQCDSPEEAQQHIDRLVRKNLAKAADPAQGQLVKLECWNCHKDIPEDERDLVCCSDCSSQWREIANAKRAAQPQMSAREWALGAADAVLEALEAIIKPKIPTQYISRSLVADAIEAFARSQGEEKNG